jgi:hypothetical protein
LVSRQKALRPTHCWSEILCIRRGCCAIAANGSYDVAAQWSAASNRALSVQYMYSVDGGAPQDCGAPVNQRANGDQFNGLCTVPALAAGSTLTISLRNDAAGYVIADAVLVTIR